MDGTPHARRAALRQAHRQTTLITQGNNAKLYQHWLDRAGVPTPRARVNVKNVAASDTPDSVGADASPNPDGSTTIQLTTDPNLGLDGPSTFYHELGHAFDYSNMTPAARAKILAIEHNKDPRGWGSLGASSTGYPNPPREAFADTYATLAQHPWVLTRKGFRRQQRYDGHGGRTIQVSANTSLTYYQLRKIAAVLQSVG